MCYALDHHADIPSLSTERNGRKTLTTVQGLPKKFDRKKILKVIKKKFGTLPSPSQALSWIVNIANSHLTYSLQWHYR